MSLRTRVALLVSGLCILLVAALGAWLWLTVKDASTNALDRELAAKADALSQIIELHKDGRIEIEKHGDEDLGFAYRLETADGRLIEEQGLRWPEREAGQGDTRLVVIKGQPFRTLERRLELKRKKLKVDVVLRVATSAAPMISLRQDVARAVLFATIAAALLGAIAAAFVARATTSPLRALAHRVADIEASTLGETITPTGNDREVVALTSAFNGLLGRLSAAFDRQRSFVARASHALRTPTATILTRAEVTLARERSAAEYREALDEIAEAARESAALVGHLLSLARWEERATELKRKPVKLRAMAQELARSLSPRARAAGVSLSFEVPDELTVDADRAALREMLEALLDNAIHYTPEGGSAGLRAADNTMTVWDTGNGMSDADKAKAFERFFRGAEAERTGAAGSGLGLAIANAVAERHGGSLELTDRDAGGLEVVVRWAR